MFCVTDLYPNNGLQHFMYYLRKRNILVYITKKLSNFDRIFIKIQLMEQASFPL